MFFGNLLVGFPLANLSLSVASSIPFTIAALAVAFSFLAILGPKNVTRVESVLFVVLISCAWWGYLWVPYAMHLIVDDLGLIAVALTHWQTINGTYIVQTSGLVILSATFVRTHSTCPQWAWVLAIVLALAAGFGGPALALSSVMMVGLIAFSHLRKQKLETMCITYIAAFVVVCAFAAFASVKLSPGSVYRSSFFERHASLSLGSVWEMVGFTALFSVKTWLLTFFNIGALSSGSIVLSTSMLIGKRKGDGRWNPACGIGSGYLCLFSLVQCVVNRLSEYFTYSGYWHYAAAQLCSFLSIVLFSVWLAERMPSHWIGRRARLLLWTLTFAAFAANAFALREMVRSMSDRQKAWQAGPAPLPGIPDIENKTGWQMGCWKALESHRHRMDPPGLRSSAGG